MASGEAVGPPVPLARLPVADGERRLALCVALASIVALASAVPFARVGLPEIPAFIPSSLTALAVVELITASLLFTHCAIEGSSRLLILAAAYLFASLVVLLRMSALLGAFPAAPQTPAWLYAFGHGGFALAVIGYGLLPAAVPTPAAEGQQSGRIILTAVVFVAIAVAAVTTVATQAAVDERTALVLPWSVWALSLLAFVIFLRRRLHHRLDLWLAVMMGGWLCSITLGTVLNGRRFDLGFYAGGSFGLLAGSLLIPVLLVQSASLQVRLAQRAARTAQERDSLLVQAQDFLLAADLERERQAAQMQAVQVARDAAVSANQAKSRFLATASHDLRQPLHAMNLFISALRRRVSGEEATKIVTGLAIATESMQAMFNSLLDVTKLEAGAVVPSFADFELEQVLQRLRVAFTEAAAAKGLALNISPSRVIVHSDPTLLESVLRNLVGNAVRYTANGQVQVRCWTYGALVYIEVRDTGPGIPPEERERIFEEFYRVGSHDAAERGLGLGLSIVRRLGALLDVAVTVSSEVGRGSVFLVRVPRAQQADAATVAAADMQSLVGRRLLLVDDDGLVRDALAREIADWGAIPMIAGSAEEAMAILRTAAELPELAIVDRDLGGDSTGPILLDQLDETLGLVIPAVVVTGATDPDALDELRRSGYPWIVKPIDVEVLRRTVSALITGALPD